MNAIAVVLILCCAVLLVYPQEAAAVGSAGTRPVLLPTPKDVVWLDGRATLNGCVVRAVGSERVVETGISQLQDRVLSLGGRTLPLVRDELTSGTVLWVGTRHELMEANSLIGRSLALPGEMCVPDGYVLRCVRQGSRDVIICAGFDARGCYYGLQTLIQLMSADDGAVSVPRVSITDWPTYRIRVVKTSLSVDSPANITRWADLLPRFKMNVLAGQYHVTGDSPTWSNPGRKYLANTQTLANAGRVSGTIDPMLYVCPMTKNRGSLLDPKTTQTYVDMFRQRVSEGFKSVVVDFNDWGTYGALSADEKARFKDIAEVTTWLTKLVYDGVRGEHPAAGILIVPPDQYYQGLPKPELISFCKAVPSDVLVMTTGPVTRSKTITAEWLKDWARAAGRKPFLWDNTLYSHLDQYRPLAKGQYNFDAFQVSFPPDMPKLLAGPGIHLNGGAQRWLEPGVLTFLDYMWSPEAYDPKTSLRNAQILLWGKDAPEVAETAQRKGVEFYDYSFQIWSDKQTGSRETAVAKLADFENAVKRLVAVIGDPVTSGEIDTYCIAKARSALATVMAKLESPEDDLR